MAGGENDYVSDSIPIALWVIVRKMCDLRRMAGGASAEVDE